MSPVTALRHSRADLGFSLVSAWVDAREEDLWSCTLSDGQAVRASRAAGCLLAPEPMDLVLLARSPGMGIYILSILQRGATPARLEVDGDLEIHATGGLSLQGEDLDLVGTAEARLQAPRMELQGASGKAAFLAFDFSAETVTSKAGRVSSMVDRLDSFVGRLTERLRTSVRWIEGLEEVRAGRWNLRVKERCSLRSRRTELLSDEEVKVDAERINLG